MTEQHELRPLDVTAIPQVQEAAEQVRGTRKPRSMVRGNEELAILQPTRKTAQRSSKGKGFTKDDSLFNIIGAAAGPDSGIHDVSTDKQKYLAEAYADLYE